MYHYLYIYLALHYAMKMRTAISCTTVLGLQINVKASKWKISEINIKLTPVV